MTVWSETTNIPCVCYVVHSNTIDSGKCSLFMCLVILAYCDNHEKVCSQTSVLTCTQSDILYVGGECIALCYQFDHGGCIAGFYLGGGRGGIFPPLDCYLPPPFRLAVNKCSKVSVKIHTTLH